MNKKRQCEYQSISQRAAKLLEGDENYDVDFKEDLSGLKPVDLVAFANSERGGAILIGIKDTTDRDGRQSGEIVGCTISDENKLAIVSKAQSCSPSLSIEIFVENLKSKPFYRIEIPSGRNKPYSTDSGKYKIRGDGRNLALRPPMLLELFLDTESKRFFDQFHKATEEMERNITNTINGILDSVHDSKMRVEELGNIIRMENPGNKADLLGLFRQIEEIKKEQGNREELQECLRKIDNDVKNILIRIEGIEKKLNE